MTKQPDLPRLAGEIARWRNETGFTQQELADAISVHVTYIQKIESTAKSKRKPAMDVLIHILAALNTERETKGLEPIDYNYALRLAGYPEIAPPVEWVNILRELDNDSTINLSTQEGVNKAAQKLLNKFSKRGSANEPGQQARSDTSHYQAGAKHTEETKENKGSKKPPRSGR